MHTSCQYKKHKLAKYLVNCSDCIDCSASPELFTAEVSYCTIVGPINTTLMTCDNVITIIVHRMIADLLTDGKFNGHQHTPNYPIFKLMIPSCIIVAMAVTASYNYRSARLLISTIAGLYFIGGTIYFSITSSY